MSSYYKILRVSKTATVDEIKRAYKKLALKWHPDKNPNNTAEANRKFREISEAYEVLSDPNKRKMYDQYGKDFNKAHSSNNYEFNDFDGFGHFNFKDPEEVFREFFGGTIFDIFSGMGFSGGSNRRRGSLFDDVFSTELDMPGTFTSFATMESSFSNHGTSPSTHVKKTSTTTQYVDGKKVTTKKIVENGNETILQYENDVLVSKLVNGAHQSIKYK